MGLTKMSLAKRTKTALDESRTLMLGAQILLGFQLEAPFQNAYEPLSEAERIASIVALLLMVFVVALLIAPSAYHRIVEAGEATYSINLLITRVAFVVLVPFALALALAIFVAVNRIGGNAVGVAAAIATATISIALWYGPLLFMRNRENAHMHRDQEETPIGSKIEYVLTESRVVLPGAQAILGFQLVIILTEGFYELSAATRMVHAISLALVGLSTALLIAPATYHRIIYGGADSAEFHRLASSMILVATLLLGLGLAADIFVVVDKMTKSSATAAALAIVSAVVLLGLWLVWPWSRRLQRADAPG